MLALLAAAAPPSPPAVMMNHVFVTPDAATYAAIAGSSFLRGQFAAMEERTTVRRDTTYTGLYVYGDNTYIEIGQRRNFAPAGTTGVGLSVDRASDLPALQARFAARLGNRGETARITRADVSGKQVPWFTELSIPYNTGQTFGIFIMAYDSRFLAQWYPQYPPSPGSTTRAASLDRYVAKIGKTSVKDNGIFKDVEGVELSGSLPRKLCTALSATVSSSTAHGAGSCALGETTLSFSGAGSLQVCTLVLKLKRQEPNLTVHFGRSVLHLSGLRGWWSFCS